MEGQMDGQTDGWRSSPHWGGSSHLSGSGSFRACLVGGAACSERCCVDGLWAEPGIPGRSGRRSLWSSKSSSLTNVFHSHGVVPPPTNRTQLPSATRLSPGVQNQDRTQKPFPDEWVCNKTAVIPHEANSVAHKSNLKNSISFSLRIVGFSDFASSDFFPNRFLPAGSGSSPRSVRVSRTAVEVFGETGTFRRGGGVSDLMRRDAASASEGSSKAVRTDPSLAVAVRRHICNARCWRQDFGLFDFS